jgi:glutamine amidotransferase
MCRHLAYVGRPITLEELIAAPPYSLVRQSWAPRMQRYGTVNADGFGVGWYTPVRSEPVRYRRAQPVWTDASFASLAPTISSACVLAAVRSATPGFGHDESCAAPFAYGTWLFSHTGRLADWPRARRELAQRTLDIPEATAPVDSALLFGLAAACWVDGASLANGLLESVHLAVACGGGRLTQLAVDGNRIAAATFGEPLYLRHTGDAVAIASEPYDDGAWDEIPDGSLVEANTSGVTITPLATP